jgi:hypothetical protein
MAYDHRIGERFMFGAEDLAANGRGAVSAEQARILDATAGAMARREPRAMGMVGVAFLVAIVAVIVGLAATPGAGAAGGVVAAVILAWIMAIVLFFMRRGRGHHRAIQERDVLTAEGPLSIRTTSTGTWYAHVGPARFAVDRYQSEVLQEDARYRVHYIDTPDGGMPLSLERS